MKHLRLLHTHLVTTLARIIGYARGFGKPSI